MKLFPTSPRAAAPSPTTHAHRDARGFPAQDARCLWETYDARDELQQNRQLECGCGAWRGTSAWFGTQERAFFGAAGAEMGPGACSKADAPATTPTPPDGGSSSRRLRHGSSAARPSPTFMSAGSAPRLATHRGRAPAKRRWDLGPGLERDLAFLVSCILPRPTSWYVPSTSASSLLPNDPLLLRLSPHAPHVPHLPPHAPPPAHEDELMKMFPTGPPSSGPFQHDPHDHDASGSGTRFALEDAP
ncbi:hypothetical protein JB92DRAFT_3108675 [Gautieria morchelliformis]|nr:hypothetical protein JB92DRAFT_3108675 [Gautieria morchelliformis]